MKFVVVGCGRWGTGLAAALGQRGHSVTVVDRDPGAFDRLGPWFRGQTVLGAGYDREALLQAGIENADGLAALTASDETNVVVARVASRFFRVPRVVARLYDPRKGEIYRRLGLPTVAPASWGVHRITEELLCSPLEAVQSLGAGQVELFEADVPHLLTGRTVSELTAPGEVHVVAVTRQSRTWLPSSGTVLEAGDRVHLAALSGSVQRLKALLGLS